MVWFVYSFAAMRFIEADVVLTYNCNSYTDSEGCEAMLQGCEAIRRTEMDIMLSNHSTHYST